MSDSPHRAAAGPGGSVDIREPPTSWRGVLRYLGPGMIIAAGLVGGDTSVVCADIQGNILDVNPEPTGWVSDVLFFAGGSGMLILPGYMGGANDGVAAAAFIAGNQTDTPSVLGFAFAPAQILGTGTSCP